MSKLKKLNRLNKSKTLSVALAVGLVVANLVTVVPAFAEGADTSVANSSIMSTTVRNSKLSSKLKTFYNTKRYDVVVTMSNTKYNTLSKITNVTTGIELVRGTDYTVVGSKITIKKAYLDKQTLGPKVFAFDMSNGTDPQLVINVRGNQVEVDADVALAAAKVAAYEAAPITTLAEIAIAEGLKAPADTAVAAVTSATTKAAFVARINVRTAAIAAQKVILSGTPAVIPTSVKLDLATNSAKFGVDYTVNATVATTSANKAGIPVTFSVNAPTGLVSANVDFTQIVLTDANGKASLKYNRSNAGVDVVTAYVAGAPSTVRDVTYVYWGIVEPLTLTPSPTGVLTNGATGFTYTATLVNPMNGLPLQGQLVNMTFLENLNDMDGNNTANDTHAVANPLMSNITPHQNTLEAEEVQATTDAHGRATFQVVGNNTTATPIAFVDMNNAVLNGAWLNGNDDQKLGKIELQSIANPITFGGAQYSVTFTQVPGAQAAKGDSNAVPYTVKVLKPDGTPYAGGKLEVQIEENNNASLTDDTFAYIQNVGNKGELTLAQDGTATFNVAVPFLSNDNQTATLRAWIDLDSAGMTNNFYQVGEPTAVAAPVTFNNEVIVNSTLAVNKTTGPYIRTANTNLADTIQYDYTLVNQSNVVSNTAGLHYASYTITNTSNTMITLNPHMVSQAGVPYTDMTVTFMGSIPHIFFQGAPITINAGNSVTIRGTAPGYVPANSFLQNPAYSVTTDAKLYFEVPHTELAGVGSLDVSVQGVTTRRLMTDRNLNDDVNSKVQTATVDFRTDVLDAYQISPDGIHSYKGTVIGYETADNLLNSNGYLNGLATGNTYLGRVVLHSDTQQDKYYVLWYTSDDANQPIDGAFADRFFSTTDPNFNVGTILNNSLTYADFEEYISLADKAQFVGYKKIGNVEVDAADDAIALYNHEAL